MTQSNIISKVFVLLFCIFTNIHLTMANLCDGLNVGDCDVAYRCDETYFIKSSCYPFDAIMNDEGSCYCPDGGCFSCSVGLIDPSSEYCTYPKNIMNLLKPVDNGTVISSDITTKLSYEEFGYPDSCGKNKKADFSCWDFSLGTYLYGAPGCLIMDDKDDGFNLSQTHRNISFSEIKSNSLPDATGEFFITNYSNGTPKALKPNNYYGIQPRIETIQQGGSSRDIIRVYFTQGDKHDNAQIMYNVSSSNSDENYFIFGDDNFSNIDTNTIIDGYRWRPMDFCGCINNCDELTYELTDGSDKGVDCYNNKYFKGLLVDVKDPSKGIYLPPRGPKRIYSNESVTVSGTTYPSYPTPPQFSWSLDPTSNFLTPIINITISGQDIISNLQINESKKIYSKSHTVYNYQFFMNIEHEFNEPQICLYSCLYDSTNSSCYVSDLNQRTASKNIESYLTTGEEGDIDAAKAYLLLPYSNHQDCVALPEFNQENAITITGRGIGSTYAEPKIAVIISDGSNSSSAILNIADKEEIENNLLATPDDEAPVLKDISDTPIFYPLALTIFQEKYLPITASNVNYCQYYYPEYSIAGITYNNSCSNHYLISDNYDSFICIHNLFPKPSENESGILSRTIPFNVNSTIVNNYYSSEYDLAFSSNLCVPTPKRINSFRYEVTNSDPENIVTNIFINYNDPKPFNDPDDNYIADGTLHDILLIEGLAAPSPGSGNTENISEIGYHNKIKIIGENNGTTYCLKYSQFDYSINNWGLETNIGDCIVTSLCPAFSGTGYSLAQSQYLGENNYIEAECDTRYSGSIRAKCQIGGNWQIEGSCTLNTCAAGSKNMGTYRIYKLTSMDAGPSKNCANTAQYDSHVITLSKHLSLTSPGSSITVQCSSVNSLLTGNITASCSDAGKWSYTNNCKGKCYSLQEDSYYSNGAYSSNLKYDRSNCGNDKKRKRWCRGYCNGDNGTWRDIVKHSGSCN
ncbi:MAG: hypothetical protein HOH73_01090 [Alphaproteobacteria bacterium]|nr:hypothetical protein [Alphaproteobacteria bacterium]